MKTVLVKKVSNKKTDYVQPGRIHPKKSTTVGILFNLAGEAFRAGRIERADTYLQYAGEAIMDDAND